MEECNPREIIATQRLILQKREHKHDADMQKAIDENRDFLREYMFWVDKTRSFDDTYAATDSMSKEWENHESWAYVICGEDDNRLIGCVGAHNISFQNQKAEIGYWLREDETCKGYMKEAVLAFENELFELGFHRLEIRCDRSNARSRMVAERCGYKLESIAREALYHYTGLHDECIYVKFSPYPIKGF